MSGGGERTPNQITQCESAGYPVQPANCSSPALFTMMGLSRVPVFMEEGRQGVRGMVF